MKVLLEWDCAKCGLVHCTIDFDKKERLDNAKCPVCGEKPIKGSLKGGFVSLNGHRRRSWQRCP